MRLLLLEQRLLTKLEIWVSAWSQTHEGRKLTQSGIPIIESHSRSDANAIIQSP
jgi:hypothetical protein